MIWLTWRQFRVQTLVATAVLAIVALPLALTRPGLTGLYNTSGLNSCPVPAECPAQAKAFLASMQADSLYPLMYFAGVAILTLAPALIGAFWGAPLIARESEARTLRLAWHQSITPARWATSKITLLALASTAFAGLLSLLISWWSAPIDGAGGFPVNGSHLSRFSAQIFDARGIVPMGYAALAFVLGTALGLLIRRTVPAMAVTLLVVAAVQIVVPNWVRPTLITPATTASPVLTVSDLRSMQIRNSGQIVIPADISDAWIVSDQTVTPSGQVFSLPDTPQCAAGTVDQCIAWIADQDLRQVVTYQPAARYWEFQWYEALLLTGATVLVSVTCVLGVRRFRFS